MLTTNPSVSMFPTNCFHNPGTTRGTKLSLLHSIVFSSLVNRDFRGLRRVFQAREQQAFLRVIAQSRTDLDRERTLVFLRLYALSPGRGKSHMFFLDLRKVSNSSELKFFLLTVCIDAPDTTTNSRSSGLFEVRFTLLDNSSRWTLSFPNFYFVPGALGEFDGVL